RNLAGIKRRWPIKQVMICGHGVKSLDIEGFSDALKSQLNTGQYKLVEMPGGSQVEKVVGLLDGKMPISFSVALVRKNIAPRVKADIGTVSQAFERADKFSGINSLRLGSYSLAFDDKTAFLSAYDVEITHRS